MKILNQSEIKQKVKRIATQILERNLEAKEIFFVGINNNGYDFAKMITTALKKISKQKIYLERIRLNPANPLKDEITYSGDLDKLKSKVVVIVDDVANSGRTIFFAFKPFFNIVPAKLEVAVLIDRTHKTYPVKPDYVGLSLATTMKENISVKIRDVEEYEVYLN